MSDPKSSWQQVITALLTLSDMKAELVRHAEHPWASASFSGSRHTVTLRFNGIEAAIVGEAMIEELPEHEFTIAGQLVADCSITSTERTVNPLTLTFEVDLLLIEEH